MIIEENGKWVGDASISFKLEGVDIVLDFISSDSFKIVVNRPGQRPDRAIEIGRKDQNYEKALNDALNFANLTLEEAAQVQEKMEQFIIKYFGTPVTNVVEGCAAQ